MTELFSLTDNDLRHFESVYSRYKRLNADPAGCLPMFIIDTPLKAPPIGEQLSDPLLMLNAQLDEIKAHLLTGDDRVPTVRVNFGTPQVAAAFGVEVLYPENSLPAAGPAVLKRANDVYSLKMPGSDAGLYKKLMHWTNIWLEHLPAGVNIQHPDIQGPFNNAHLIRGNDILTDMYDHPDTVCRLLDLVTDYLIDLIPRLKKTISDDPAWFFDWFSLWKGCAGLRNCSATMISPEFYREFVLPRDARLLEALGGGRIHYCGTSAEVIRDFFTINGLTGFDYDAALHDPWKLAEIAPEHVVLFHWDINGNDPAIQRFINGEFPDKRNMIIRFSAGSTEEARELLQILREGVQKKFDK